MMANVDIYSNIIGKFLSQYHLHIVFKKSNRIQHYYPELFSFELSLKINQQNYYALGVDEDQMLATAICILELSERIAFDHYHLQHPECRSSNGFAAHIDESMAAENAIRELVERDAFMTHYLSGVPFRPVTIPSEVIPKNIHPDDCYLAKMQTSAEYQAYIAFIRTHKGGFLCGLSCHKSSYPQSLSMRKAFIEAVNAYHHFLPHDKMLSLNEFRMIDNPQPYHHVFAGMNPDLGKPFFEKYYQSFTEEKDRNLKPKDVFNIEIESIKYTPSAFDKTIFISKAHSKDLQDLYWGEASKSMINPVRFQDLEYSPLSPIHLLP